MTQERSWMQTEWTPQAGMLPALSVRQPFLMAIVLGKKCIEIREWGTHFHLRHPDHRMILLHAGKRWDGQDSDSKAEKIHAMEMAKPIVNRLGLPKWSNEYPLGALVGVAQLTRCAPFTEEGWYRLQEEHQHDGSWQPGRWGWKFEDVQRFVDPVPYRGVLGLFAVEEALVAEQIAGAIAVPFAPMPRPAQPEDPYRPSDMVARYGPLLAEEDDDGYPSGYQKNEIERPDWL